MKAQQEGIDSAKEFWLNSDLFPSAAERPGVATRLKKIVDDYSAWHFLNDDPASMPDTPAIDRLGSLTMSMLIVLGERDLPDIHNIADILEDQVPGAEKVVIPGVGHMSNMEDPKRFNEIVLEFLSTLRQ